MVLVVFFAAVHGYSHVFKRDCNHQSSWGGVGVDFFFLKQLFSHLLPLREVCT